MKLSVIRQRSLWWTVSAVVILAGIAAMIVSWQQIGTPLRLGLDFVGGTRLQIERDCSQPQNCETPLTTSEVRDVLEQQGLENSSVQIVGEEEQGLSIRTKTLDVEQRSQLQAALTEEFGEFDPEATQIDTVGPIIGQQILSSGLISLIVAFAAITVYLSWRFQLDYALLALLALVHDILVVVSVFAIMGLVLGTEVDSLFIVALLTIAGFSVNDTVVIYDRIREVIVRNPGRHVNEIVDESVNQTLARSINTTLTTVLTLFAILIFGGETLKDFAFALILGFLAGAYSSIFVASTLLAWWRVKSGRAIVEAAPPPEPTSGEVV
jgi:preprotein translocase subunit SecF